MAKLTLATITSGYNLASINANFQAIEDFINDSALSRDVTAEANQCAQDIDLNSNKITNVADGVAGGDAVNKAQMDAAIAAG